MDKITLNSKQRSALKEAYQNEGFQGLLIACDISADEYVFGKLDEDMTDEEYAEWGPDGGADTLKKFRKEGTLKRKKKGKYPLTLTLEQRREILRWTHLAFKKEKVSVKAFEKTLGF